MNSQFPTHYLNDRFYRVVDITGNDFNIPNRPFSFPNNTSIQSKVTIGKSSRSNCYCSYKTSFPSINVFVAGEAHNKNRQDEGKYTKHRHLNGIFDHFPIPNSQG